ncbi:MAG: DUF4974 domain-containing protein [Bacteroidales bacterium]|nr:DUF4974 domain-containing protein [Bacteroidales bacterium]
MNMKLQEEHIKSLLIRFFSGKADSSEKDELLAWLHQSKENVDYSISCYKKWSGDKIFENHFGKEEGWRRFVAIISRPVKRRIVLRRSIYYGMTAVVVLMIGLYGYLRLLPSSHPDIMKFAQTLSGSVDMRSSTVKLVLSSDSMLTFNTKAANIQYKSGRIICNSNQTVSDDASAAFNQLIVPFGHSSNLTLSDGTRIWLNAGTRLIYPVSFKEKTREIYVEGEIYLEVAHDADHPFIVRTSQNMDVRVLGTHFDVKAYRGGPLQRVVLVSGSVQVSQNNALAKLLPNEMYEVRNGGSAVVKQVDPSYYISWTKGLYLTNDERLGDIFSDLMKYYGVDMKYDASVSSLRCSGKLDLKDNFESVMKAISETAPIVYNRNNNKYYVHLK